MRLFKRMTKIQAVYVNSVGLSSVFQIGDSCSVTPKVKVLALQREADVFSSREGNLNQYPLYREEIPQPTIHEPFEGAVHNQCPTIRVKGIRVMAVSSSGVAHFGSTDQICTESRVKHIRQLLSD